MRSRRVTPPLARMRTTWASWWQVILLGVLTIGSYGAVVYSFGVLISPIHEQTGWSIGLLSVAYTLTSLLGGVASLASGRLLDRLGGRPVMLASLAAGSAFLLLASAARSAPLFVAAWGLGGGIIGAGLFYNVTMAITTRLYPAQRVRAFTILTFTGGFASVLYFPLAGALVDALDWRVALRVLVVLMALHVIPAAALVGGAKASTASGETGDAETPAGSVLQAFLTRDVLRMVAMFSLASMAFGAMQVHHVPAMEAAGLSLGAATTIASVRGLMSLPGRAMLDPLIGRLGVRGAMSAVYGLMAVGALPLMLSGSLAWPLLFMVLTGIVFGSVSPLQGLYAVEVYGEQRLGALMGMQSLVVSMVSAFGPTLLGLTVDATGGYELELLLIAALFCAALALLLTQPRPAPRVIEEGLAEPGVLPAGN